jgi:hypothetical protein
MFIYFLCVISTLFILSFYLPSSSIEYTCHGSWRENQTTFIVARHSKYVVCISFKQLTTDTAQLFIGDSCYRENQGPEVAAERQYTVANLTNVGRKLKLFLTVFWDSKNSNWATLNIPFSLSLFPRHNIDKCGDINSSTKIKTTWHTMGLALVPWWFFVYTALHRWFVSYY